MEITGSGQKSNKDIWVSILYSYKHMLKAALGIDVIMLLAFFIAIKYYLDTTFLGMYYNKTLELDTGQYGGFVKFLVVFILLLMAGAIFFIFSSLIVILAQFVQRRVLVGRQENVVIRPSGIEIVSEKLSDLDETSIGWASVKRIKVKKQYLHIYTTSRTKLHFIIPRRYFSEDNLSGKINQIRTINEVKE